MTFKPIAFAVLAAAGVCAHAAGSVQINFVQPEKFTDIKDGSMTREMRLAALKEEFEAAAAPYVADGQTMKIDVLDVDLAGQPSWRFKHNDVRILRGGADWPVIKMRWSLESPGQAARSGEATLSDMAYLQRSTHYASGAMPYERRMIDDWFAKEFRRN